MLIPDNPIADFLKQEFFETKHDFFDYWLVLHFLSGILIAFFIDYIQLGFKYFGFELKNYVVALILLILWEFFEYLTRNILFRPETFVNILWDILIGMFGYLIIRSLIYFF